MAVTAVLLVTETSLVEEHFETEFDHGGGADSEAGERGWVPVGSLEGGCLPQTVD